MTDSGVVSASTPSSGRPKKLKRVRKNRDSSTSSAPTVTFNADLGSSPWKTLTSSRLYLFLVLVRFVLLFVTPASLEGTEFADGVDSLAHALLPSLNVAHPAKDLAPAGLNWASGNQTRSIAGAFVHSGLPYMALNLACRKGLDVFCGPDWLGWMAIYLPRIWMFALGLIGDVLLARAFAVYEGENAVWGLLLYASSWTTLLGMTRNCNFALESLCVAGMVAACFGWPINTARPLFWLSATSLSFGVFLRPAFVWFAFTPMIYLFSLWGKSGVHTLRYARGMLEGLAVLGFWCTLWVSVDSVYYGTFRILVRGKIMTSFDMFVDAVMEGGWSGMAYKGKLVYTPLNAMYEVANRKFISTLALNTSPGQMFLSLPAILGPLFAVLLRESYEGFKTAMKELMTEMKQVANAKKPKKRKPKKPGMTKELEDELYVYFDTIQTTFLMGLLIEVVQNNDRLGVMSLLSLISPCVVCIAGTIFGPNSSVRFRALHLAFSALMVVFYGLLHQAGIPRTLVAVGAGLVPMLQRNTDLVLYKGIVGHRAALGMNVKNISVHDGGNDRRTLMTTLRDLKEKEGYREDRLVICAPETEEMKEEEFVKMGKLGSWHMSMWALPKNVDEAVKRNGLIAWRFVGDEDEAMMADDEEAAEREEREREQKERRKKGAGGKDEL